MSYTPVVYFISTTYLRDQTPIEENVDDTKITPWIIQSQDTFLQEGLGETFYDRLKDDGRVDFYGSGCEKTIEFKTESLKDYMFSIVIENSIESDYFTEKILDCFLSGTIPVYVGSKTTSQYFDENGIIYFEGDEDLPEILNKLNSELYVSKLESVKSNFELAKKYMFPEQLIQNFLNENV